MVEAVKGSQPVWVPDIYSSTKTKGKVQCTGTGWEYNMVQDRTEGMKHMWEGDTDRVQ